MGGLGTRLRPHTWSKPKQLISVAGKTVLDHVLDSLSTLPKNYEYELINIVGYRGDQIEDYMNIHHPEIKSTYVVQENPRGQSHAIQLASKYLDGPMLMVFGDTLSNPDLSLLGNETAGAVAWVKQVNDPRRFGVAVVDQNGCVTRLIEKPEDMNNNLAVVGFYYFQDSHELITAISEQMDREIKLKGEYYLVDAINIMLEHGLKMRTEKVNIWLDAGTSQALIETNRYLLENGHDNSADWVSSSDVVISPPVYIHPTANVQRSIIGPCVSIGAGCKVKQCILKDTILEDEAQTTGVILEDSLVGRCARLDRRAGKINAGDNTVITL